MPLADATQTQQPDNGQAPARTRAPASAVHVVAPARLHLGFLDLNGSLGRRFGSLGLAIDKPATELILSRSRTFGVTGQEQERGLKVLRRFASALAPSSAYQLDIREAIPSHAGLGSGTQLALAIGSALMAIEGLDGSAHSAHKLGELADRGARSAIGMGAFESGGFIVDGGRGAADRSPPVLIRAQFPDAWRGLLIFDPRTAGVHGNAETEAFATLPPLDEQLCDRICRLVLMRLVPGLMEADIEAFGSAVTEIQAIIGSHFAAAQGGGPWASPAVGNIAQRLKDAGAFGIGQSSWGPTGFAFTPSQENADDLYDSSIEAARAEGLEILIVKGRNRGAFVERITSP